MHLCTAIVYNQTSNNTFAGSLQAKSIHVHDFTDSPLDILVNNWGISQTMYYVHKDYLGSITAISDANGNLVESLSHNPCSVKLGFCEHSETKALVEGIPAVASGNRASFLLLPVKDKKLIQFQV